MKLVVVCSEVADGQFIDPRLAHQMYLADCSETESSETDGNAHEWAIAQRWLATEGATSHKCQYCCGGV